MHVHSHNYTVLPLSCSSHLSIDAFGLIDPSLILFIFTDSALVLTLFVSHAKISSMTVAKPPPLHLLQLNLATSFASDEIVLCV